MPDIYFIAMIYEGCIIILTSLLLYLTLKQYIKNRNIFILILFLIYLNYFLAMIFSWLSKMLIIFSNIDYLREEEVPDPLTPVSGLLLRILAFRISFFFITNAILLSYVFKVKMFESNFKKVKTAIIIVFDIFTATYSLVFYVKGHIIFDVFAFFFVFILMGIVYIPFMMSSIKAYKNSKINHYKKAFFSLTIMSLSFVLIFFCFLIDRLFILLGHFGFTIFYFLAWIFVIIGIIGSYFGYLHLNKMEE